MLTDHLRSNVVGYLALAVALSGTSYAAVRLEAGSVGTRQLKNGAVTTPKVRDGAVTSAKVRDGAVGTADVADGSLQRGDLAPGVLVADWVFTRAGGLNPVAVPDTPGLSSVTVTLPRTGSYHLRHHNWFTYRGCSLGVPNAGLYVDGTPVPGSRAIMAETASDASPTLDLVGLVQLSAGQHTFSVGHDCPSGAAETGSVSAVSNWTVTLVHD